MTLVNLDVPAPQSKKETRIGTEKHNIAIVTVQSSGGNVFYDVCVSTSTVGRLCVPLKSLCKHTIQSLLM